MLVTHDVGQAAKLADAALVLGRGRAVHRQGLGPQDAPGGGDLDPEALERAYLGAAEAAA